MRRVGGGDNIIKKIMSQTRVVLRVDQMSEEIVNDLFLRVCIKVDLRQSLKSKLKYYMRCEIKSARIDYEGVLESYFGYGLVDHKFEECPKMEKMINIKIEEKEYKFQRCS